MTQCVFAPVLASAAELAPRLAVDALDELELLPAMLHEVRSFCSELVDGQRIDREGALGPALLGAAAERGWFGLTVPAEHGGAGLSLAAAARMVTELAAHDGSLGTCVGLHSGLALHALLHAGSRDLQAHYLPEVAAGRRIAAFAATEPNAGSDISAVRTRLSEVGGRLILNGSKCYVTNGGLCGLVTVLTQSPGLGGARAGHTLILVDPEWPGVTRGREEHKMGLRGSSTMTLDFDDVHVPTSHVLGELSRGMAHAHAALGWGRTFMAAGCLGTARAALGVARQHTAVRQQFGRTLDRFQLVRDRLARAAVEVHAIESTLRLVCALSDAGLAEVALPSTIVKVLASEGAWRVVDDAVQVMGGAGYTEGGGVARRLRDVRVTRIFEGANDVLRVSLASAALGWPVAALLDGSPALDGPPSLAADLACLRRGLVELGEGLRSVKKRWGFRLFEQQAVAADLADAIIASFAALAVLLRATRSLPGDGAGVELTRLTSRRLLARARQHLSRALAPPDPEERGWIEALVEGPATR